MTEIIAPGRGRRFIERIDFGGRRNRKQREIERSVRARRNVREMALGYLTTAEAAGLVDLEEAIVRYRRAHLSCRLEILLFWGSPGLAELARQDELKDLAEAIA